MNKRLLLSLYDRSGLGAYMPVDLKGHELKVEEHMEKFAELIVRECADTVAGVPPCHGDYRDQIETGMRDYCSAEILKHFGVDSA